MKTVLVWLLALVVAALAIGAWQLHQTMRAATISGQVFAVENPDSVPAEWRVAPFAGAGVLVMWSGDLQNNPVDSSRICLRALRLAAEADGSFSVPEWRVDWRWPLVTDVEAVAYVVEPGFASVRDQLQGREAWMTTDFGKYLTRRSLPPDRKALEYLERTAQQCERHE